MAHSFSTNNNPTTGSRAVYLFLATLVAAGWTKTKDSDGSTFSALGTQITSGASGTNGLANNSAWFVLRAPAVLGQQRSFCFQRGTTNQAWRIKYSYAAGFVGGSPTSIQVPSATDEVIVRGGGSDASPTFENVLQTDGSYRFNVCAGDTTVGYGFYWLGWTATGNPANQGVAFMLDVLAPGSYPSADLDPAVIYTDVGGSLWYNTKLPYQNGTNAACQVRAYFGLGGVATWTSLIAAYYCDAWQPNSYAMAGFAESGGLFTNGTNGWTSKDDLVPVPYGRPKSCQNYGPAVNTYGWKGIGQLVKYAAVLRGHMDTLSVDGGTKNYVWLNGTALPWDGSTPTI